MSNLARDWVRHYKQTHPCTECGETEFYKLEFHHRNPFEKSFAIGTAVREGRSLQDIFQEAAKCDIVCTDCHKEIHEYWKAIGYWLPREINAWFPKKHLVEMDVAHTF